MSERMCKKLVSYGGGFEFRRCGRVALHGDFCGVHDPERPDKVRRREEARATFNARVEAHAAPFEEIKNLRERIAELEAEIARLKSPGPTGCVCGDIGALNVVHRSDGPCYHIIAGPPGPTTAERLTMARNWERK